MPSKKLKKEQVDILVESITLDKTETNKRGRKVKKHYVDPEEFKQKIIQYYNDGIITEELGKFIYDIANRLGFAPNFINYSFKEDMIGDAIIKMMQALHNKKYDPEKGNAFLYYTMIAHNAFCNRIKREKRGRETLSGYQEKFFDLLSEYDYINNDDHDNNDLSHEQERNNEIR